MIGVACGAASKHECYFQNNDFCGQVGIVINSSYTIFPAGSWGGMTKLAPTGELYLQAGVYEVNSMLPLPHAARRRDRIAG